MDRYVIRVVFVGGDGGDYPRYWFSRSPPLVLLKTSLAGMLFIPCTAKILRTSHPLVCDCDKGCKNFFACGELSSSISMSFTISLIFLCDCGKGCQKFSPAASFRQ